MYGDTENQKLQGPTVIEGFPYVFFFKKLKNIFLEFLVKISSLYLEKWLSYWYRYKVRHSSSSSDYTVQTQSSRAQEIEFVMLHS